WSAGILVRELAAFYRQFAVRSSQSAVRGKEPGIRNQDDPESANCELLTAKRELLPPLPIQYADFARWQRGWLSGEVLERQIEFWTKRLHGVQPLELPADRPRPPVFSQRGKSLAFRWPPALLDDLRALSQASDATLFMTLLAAFQVLLQRWSGQDDFGIGCPIANRNRSEIEPLIGFFVNTLVMRLPVAGDPSFRELLTQARQTCLEAYTHQDVPFEQLVEELQPERSLSRTPLFQVMFALQNAPMQPISLEGLQAEPLEVESTAAKFDLALAISESEEGLTGIIEFRRDLFDASTMRRLSNQLHHLLQDAAAQPEKAVAQLALMSAAERHQALVEFNATDQQIPGRTTLLDLIEEQERSRPQAVALTFGQQALSYAALQRLSRSLSASLLNRGARPENPVGVLADRSLEMVAGMLSVLRSGAPYLPLDPSHPKQRLAFQVQDACADLVLAQPHLVGGLQSAACQLIDLNAGSPRSVLQEFTCGPVLPQNLAYLIYTSGSTGRPKGVGIQHDSLLNLIRWQQRAWAITPEDRAGQAAPFTFDASVWEIWPYLAAGASVHISDDETRLSPPALQEWLINKQITLSFIPTPVMEILLKAEWPESLALRSALTGGDKLRHWPGEELPFRLVNNYGPTEYTAITTSATVPKRRQAFAPPIGYPVDNTCLYVLDRQLRPQPLGVFGELCLAGAGIARGYWRRSQLNAAAFLPNPFRGRGARIYPTGDLVRWRNDGQIDFLGRRDRQVQIRGLRIELGEIEAALSGHPEVREASVVVVEERLVGFVSRRRQEAGGRRQEERGVTGSLPLEPEAFPDLRSHLKAHLPAYMIPSLFFELDALPLTANGKVDRKALEGLVPQDLPAQSSELRTPAEQLLAGIWEEVLEIEGIGRQAHFFELGGHSLLATQVVSRIRCAFGVDLAVGALFEDPVLGDLARRIGPAQFAQAPQIALERRPRDGDLPLSFAQQRLWFLDQLQPGTALYNIPAALQLRDGPHPSFIEAGLNEIVRRHEALRTCFPARHGRPLQRIQDQFRLALPIIDLSGLDNSVRKRERNRLARNEARRPFDLANGPLIRATLIVEQLAVGRLQSHGGTEAQRSELSPSSVLRPPSSVLLLSLHHIASDGWSMGILLSELSILCQALSNSELRGRSQESGVRSQEDPESDHCELRTADREPSALCQLPTLPIQYADFACWQREWLTGERLDQQTGYWKKQLQGIQRQELPADRVRPAQPFDRGTSWTFRWPAKLCAALQEFSRSRDVTLFMTLLASLHIVLGRWSGQTDVAAGVPVAGRNRPEIEPLIGFFVNTLVMRSDLSGNPPFEDFLLQVRRTALDAYAHQDLPFEQLVEELRPQRSLGRTPFFQLLFMLQNLPGLDPERLGLGQVSALEAEGEIAKFDLALSLMEAQGRLEGTVTFRTDLFDATTAQRLIVHWHRLTAVALADPRVRLDDLPLLGQGECHQLVQEWNDSQAPFSRQQLIHQLFESRCAEAPDRVALVFGEAANAHLCYRALDGWAESLARQLRQLGAGPGQTVGVCLPRSGELISSLLAVLKSGAAYVPAEPGFPRLRIGEYLQQARAGLCLTTVRTAKRSGLDELPVRKVFVEEAPSRRPSERMAPAAGAGDLAYVIFTSGSTG
ncbi:MAG: amino acid adenylation domain-containing protein, partial [Acidobacteriota bacterium]